MDSRLRVQFDDIPPSNRVSSCKVNCFYLAEPLYCHKLNDSNILELTLFCIDIFWDNLLLTNGRLHFCSNVWWK